MSFPFHVQLVDGEELVTGTAKLHDLGTRGITEDGRVYRYCRATSDGIARPYWGAQSRCLYKAGTSDDSYEGDSSAAVTLYDMTMVIPDTNTDHIADFFAGGYAVLFYAVNTRIVYIKASTASDAETVTLTFGGRGIPETKSTAVFCTIHPSPYSQVERVHGGGSTQAATVCVPNTTVSDSEYFWGQTWGPCFCTATPAYPGTSSYERSLSWNYDGSVSLTPAFTTASYRQIAGWLLAEMESDGDSFFMLTISP